MKNEEKDEVIEELWEIKDGFSSSCDKDIREITEKMNRIVAKQRSIGEEVNLREKTQAA